MFNYYIKKMSLPKEDINKNTKYNERLNFNNSSINYARMKPNLNSNSISRVMSNFIDNLSLKQRIIEKELKHHNSTIIKFQKKRNKIMSKNNFILSLSTSKFPLISSRYKDIFLSQNQKKNKVENFNTSCLKNKTSSFNYLDLKEIKKSKSEYKIDNIDKNKNDKFFQTSIGRNQKLVKFSSDLIKDNDSNLVNSNIHESENMNTIIKENNTNEENKLAEIEKDKMNNIMYRLSKISNLNTKISSFSEEENIKEKRSNLKHYSKLNNKKLNNNSKKLYRRKKFKIDVIKGWEFSNGLSFNNFNEKGFIEDKEYQKNVISNQIDIIIDNTNYFKLNYINILADYIKNDDINQKFLIILNKLLEETSALYIEISHLVIKDFESFLYVKHKLPTCSPSEMVDGIEVIDEKLEFGTNIKILNECTKFLTSSYEIYLVLNIQSNYVIPKKKFIKIRHYLNRARFNINNVVSHSQKYIKELRYEKSIINQFNEQQELIDKNLKLKNKQYFNCDRNTEGMERLKDKSKNYQNVIGHDKMRRLNNLLNTTNNNNNNEYFHHKRSTGKHIDLSDKMFNKIVEYMEPQIKERFEAFSVTQKKISNKNERKVYKFDF